MKVSSPLTIKYFLWLLIIFSLPPSAFALDAQESQGAQQAKELWEQAIAAKGGRDQLYKVNSLLMSYTETTRNFLGIVVHRGLVERIYVFPGKVWGWDDGLPPPFHLSVGMLNVGLNLRCTIYAGASKPVCGPAQQGISPPDAGISQMQYLYLMETRWVKPVPLGVTRDSIGLKKVDLLHTRFGNEKVDYYLDRKTHLPLRVAVFYGGSRQATLKIDLSEYVMVDGVQMPTKQKSGKISFQINPPYDEDIFTRPPSIELGPHAWQRAVRPTS
jgi:hypothetical protein